MNNPARSGTVTRIHPTATIEPGVIIGNNTAIWESVHVRRDTSIGDDCIIGEKTYIAYGVKIGHRVKINAMAYVCTGVTIEDGVMISAGVIFTNDRFPRAATSDLQGLRSSGPDETTMPTLVRRGATIGAGSVIGSGLEIGEFAMVGMGAVVTRSIPAFSLSYGNPARPRGFVCRCGQILFKFSSIPRENAPLLTCAACSLAYCYSDGKLMEKPPPLAGHCA